MSRAIVLLSGGIDSPVAVYFALQKGLDVVLLHCINVSVADENYLAKIKQLTVKLGEIAGKKLKLITVEHGKHQEELVQKCDPKFTCIYCKRFMYQIAEKIAEAEGAQIIVTGENLGQVASQTMHNLGVLQSSVKMPILRPLIAMDKQDIIDIAKKIGTYEISITNAAECQRLPKQPSTAAKLQKIKEEERKVNATELLQLMFESRKEY
jgi:thiamine biosynthesis protein ThiI